MLVIEITFPSHGLPRPPTIFEISFGSKSMKRPGILI